MIDVSDWELSTWADYQDLYVSYRTVCFSEHAPQELGDVSEWALSPLHRAMTDRFDPLLIEWREEHKAKGMPCLMDEIGVIAFALKLAVADKLLRKIKGYTEARIGAACDEALSRLGYFAHRIRSPLNQQVCFVQGSGAPPVLATIRSVLLKIGRPIYAVEVRSSTGLALLLDMPKGPWGITVAEASQVIPEKFWTDEQKAAMQEQREALASDLLMQ